MTKKPKTPRDEVKSVLDYLTTMYALVDKERQGVRVARAAHDDPEARQRLSDSYRTELRQLAVSGALERVGGEGRQALARAEATMASRESLVGIDAVLRRAMFVEPIPGPDYSDPNILPQYKPGGSLYRPDAEAKLEQQRTLMNELRLLRDEATRSRCREELRDCSNDTEMAQQIHEAAARGDLAFLGVARRELGRRPVESMTNARVAMATALRAIELPTEVKQLDEMFTQIDNTARRLSEALAEIVHDDGHGELTAKINRVRELHAEHGKDAPRIFAEERRAARQATSDAAKRRAEKDVQDATRLDDADGAASTNPAA